MRARASGRLAAGTATAAAAALAAADLLRAVRVADSASNLHISTIGVQ
jgi:hypothetical protein